MTSFKTPQGTELPLMDLKGKPYLNVAYRLVWFREQCPNWSLITEIVFADDTQARFKATILDGIKDIVATAHGSETKAGFRFYFEKAETKAVGRVLAFCGFGTQFAHDDLDEGEDGTEEKSLPDAPITPVKVTQTPIALKLARQALNALVKEGKIPSAELAEFVKTKYGKSTFNELTQPEITAIIRGTDSGEIAWTRTDSKN